MNKEEITQHINQIKIAIIHLTELNDRDALIYAHNDLKYYNLLLDGFN